MSADAFVHAATSGRRNRAQQLLDGNPQIAEDPWAALVLGCGFDGDPQAPGGPRGWAPLLYVCHSVFASPVLARELLDRGADPDATFTNEFGAMSALCGAAGVLHDPELTRVLLEAGANPDDGESVYHATEPEDTACLQLLIEHGAEVEGTNALARSLDDDRLEHVRLLLAAGARADQGAYLAHAIRRGCGLPMLELLLDAGAQVDQPGGEMWRDDVRLRTPYQHAVLRGQDEAAALLAKHGARTDIDPGDRAVAALARGADPSGTVPDVLDWDPQEVLVLTALRGRLEAVVDAVGVGFVGVVGGSPPGTLLHHAAWVGSPDLVRELLDRSADPRATTAGTPLSWAAMASGQRAAGSGRDHRTVGELLVAAGADVEPGLAEEADGPLADWLRSQS